MPRLESFLVLLVGICFIGVEVLAINFCGGGGGATDAEGGGGVAFNGDGSLGDELPKGLV
jgi:hypothetical protein